jgi:hypothetical protein
MCPVKINSDKVGGIYVDGAFTTLPYTVESGQKKLISQRHRPGFRYMVFGADHGGYYMAADNPFNSKIEIETAQEVYLGVLTLTGQELGR